MLFGLLGDHSEGAALMPSLPWNNNPDYYIEQARIKAIAALHAKHSEGLTTLEKAFFEALSSGRIPPDMEGPNQ